jgi:hypothetical protein
VSCLMHLEGIAKRQKNPVRVLHISEILASGIGEVQQKGERRAKATTIVQ